MTAGIELAWQPVPPLATLRILTEGGVSALAEGGAAKIGMTSPKKKMAKALASCMVSPSRSSLHLGPIGPFGKRPPAAPRASAPHAIVTDDVSTGAS